MAYIQHYVHGLYAALRAWPIYSITCMAYIQHYVHGLYTAAYVHGLYAALRAWPIYGCVRAWPIYTAAYVHGFRFRLQFETFFIEFSEGDGLSTIHVGPAQILFVKPRVLFFGADLRMLVQVLAIHHRLLTYFAFYVAPANDLLCGGELLQAMQANQQSCKLYQQSCKLYQQSYKLYQQSCKSHQQSCGIRRS